MAETVSVADAKRRFSELVNRAAFGKERFLIERHGKPVGALISAADLARLEQQGDLQSQTGLAAAAGAFADFEEFEQIMEEVVAERRAERHRPVELE
jgi:prevent-host-death family protein